tara:strand:+ start:4727 stop:5374 length:648 start_codon:yes stop_codon:yes gene_type:complete
MAIADAFVGLPIESLILDPLLSAAKGQAALAQVTLDFVEALAFEENDGKDNSRKTKLLDIDLDRLANKADGSITNISQKIQMPLLPLVTIPNFTLDTMEIDFMMEVKTSESSSTKDNSSNTNSSSVGTDTNASVSYGFWGVKAKVSTSVQTENKTSGTISSSKDTQRSSDQSAKYHINVKAKQNEPAEGMAKFTQILSSIIEPINVTQADNTAGD